MIVLCLSMQEEEIIEHITAKCHIVTLGNGQHVHHWCNLGIGLIIDSHKQFSPILIFC